MRALIQCVSHAEVSIDDAVMARIGRGFVVLLGVGANDTEVEVERLWAKIAKLRVFEDEQGKTNRSLSDIGGEVLVVWQFML
ncbi:MAG: D-aminoacyl-tRNA deacylase [Coriobacteriales bacterium]